MTRLTVQLARLGFLSPRSLWQLFRARKKHGDNIAWMLQWAAAYYTDKTALSDGKEAFSFSFLWKEVQQLAAYLQQSQIVPEGKYAILACYNNSPHTLWLYAMQAAGIPLILIHPKTPAKDIRHIRSNYPGAVLFTDEPEQLQLDNSHSLLTNREWAKESTGILSCSRKQAPLIFPSSGSTGRPKLIPKKPGAFYWLNAFADLVLYTGIHKISAVFISTPLTHGFGYTSLVFSLIMGKKAVINRDNDISAIASLICKEKTDLLTGVPSSLYLLSKELAGKEHPVKLIISGGAPLNETIFSEVTHSLSKNFFSFYGSTEVSTSFITCYDELCIHIHALGRPLKGIQYRLENLNGGATELWIKSPMSNVSPGEWFATGDLVAQEKNGSLSWRGRKDNMIIKNGLNIYPEEIENEILPLPGISDVLVTGVKDSVKGQKLVAMVLMKAGFDFNEDNIREQLKSRLAGIKLPDTIIQVAGFRETNTGKKSGFLTIGGQEVD
jgi:acyl-CoA synthetase (AMP-forming)/AMP-acid ligase II